MSVHDDGPPRFDRSKKSEAGAEPTPPMSAKTVVDTEKDDQLAANVKAEAMKLLAERIAEKATMTSLEFKHALRRRCVEMEPTPIISQEDVSRFLKRWFLERGEAKDGYAFREKPALDSLGQPKPGRTVYNEYFYAPNIRNEEKHLEEKFEAVVKGEGTPDEVKAARNGFIEWVKGLWR